MWSGPAWRVPDEIPTFEHKAIPVTPADDELVRLLSPVLAADDLPWRLPCLSLLDGGRLASVCFSARNTSIAAEAGVQTREEFRGRGYAPAVVAAWARAVRQEERIPLYSTSWDNLASRSVARKLGLLLYGVDLSIE
jgi:RimJ/RimL family protein N-acetyltransferase